MSLFNICIYLLKITQRRKLAPVLPVLPRVVVRLIRRPWPLTWVLEMALDTPCGSCEIPLLIGLASSLSELLSSVPPSRVSPRGRPAHYGTACSSRRSGSEGSDRQDSGAGRPREAGRRALAAVDGQFVPPMQVPQLLG